MRTPSLFVCSTVGGTRYLSEWLGGVKLLNPSIIVIARDLDRSEDLEPSPHFSIIDYRSGKPWKGYEHRHENWESDYSIALGIYHLMKFFLIRSETHFLHVDTDVIIDKRAVSLIYPLNWDSLNLVVPVVPRDHPNPASALPMRFWDSTNFGLKRDYVERVFQKMERVLKDPYPVDIKIHDLIREENPKIHRDVSIGISHYICGRKVRVEEAV